MAITEFQLRQLNGLLAAGQEHGFYCWRSWQRLRKEVLRMDHYECQVCRRAGRHSKAVIVHHVKHLRDRPDLAMSVWDGEQRQLESVCKACHEALHPERLTRFEPSVVPLTPERWD